jgi:hypothetical protein
MASVQPDRAGSHRRVNSPGGQLYVSDWAGPEPAFVMVHGFPDDSAGQPGASSGAGPPLSAPVHRVTPTAVLRQTMTLTPQVRRMIRPLAAPSITAKCSPCRAASRRVGEVHAWLAGCL